MVFLAEKAGAQFAVGGEPEARAMAAEGLRDRRDQADFAAAVGEAEFARRFAALVDHGHQRPARGDALHALPRR